MKNRRRLLGLIFAGFAGVVLAQRRSSQPCGSCPGAILPGGNPECGAGSGECGDGEVPRAEPAGERGAVGGPLSSGNSGRSRVLALMATVLLSGALGCHRESGPAGPAVALPSVEVRVGGVAAGRHQAVEEVVGTVRARRRAVIEAKVSGRIVVLTAVPGRPVRAGEVLLEVEAREIGARIEQARAVLEQAERELVRFTTLLKQEAVTRAEYDGVESRQRVAKAALLEAETLGSYTRVTAPFDGVVVRKLADVGDLAAPGRGLLEIEDPASVRLEADVPLQLVDRVKLGDRLTVTVVGTAERTMEAVVSEIEPTADSASRTFRMKLDLPPESGARAGAFGRVSVPVAEAEVLRVPAAAVQVRGQMEVAFVVSEDRARLRLVKTGKRSGTEVEVVSGLMVGERVVVAGGEKLLDGQPLVVR